ncbi:hypothetical protein C8J57DRAFT_1498963 [Mycena rebaudengoi]|nr:hypothetical protein C8J57DRAFT_1498963 [Mycena rebaudengoi]
MSFITRRSVSPPPPRSVSPEAQLDPLPIRRPSPPTPRRPTRLSLQSAAQPKSERVQRLERTLNSMRSTGDLRASQSPRASRFIVSAPSTPRSESSAEFKRVHRRTMSFAAAYRSPPSSPILCDPPPVPPIPAFALAPTDKKPVLHTPPPPLPRLQTQIYLPEWEKFTVIPDALPSPSRKPRRSPMTSSFFSLHKPAQRVAV